MDQNVAFAHENALLAAYLQGSDRALSPLDRRQHAAAARSAAGEDAGAARSVRWSASRRRCGGSLVALRALDAPGRAAGLARRSGRAARPRRGRWRCSCGRVGGARLQARRVAAGAFRKSASARGRTELAAAAIDRYSRRYAGLSDAYTQIRREEIRLRRRFARDPFVCCCPRCWSACSRRCRGGRGRLPAPTVSVDPRYAVAGKGIARTDFASDFASDTPNARRGRRRPHLRGGRGRRQRRDPRPEHDRRLRRGLLRRRQADAADQRRPGARLRRARSSCCPTTACGSSPRTDIDPATGTSNLDVVLLSVSPDGRRGPELTRRASGSARATTQPTRAAYDPATGRIAIVGYTNGQNDSFVAVRNADGSPAAFGVGGSVIFDQGAGADRPGGRRRLAARAAGSRCSTRSRPTRRTRGAAGSP